MKALARSALVNRLARTGLWSALGRLREGELVVEEGGRETRFGRPSERVPWSGRVTVHDPAFFGRAALGGTIGLCESYMDGDWDADDLATVGRILLGNRDLFHGLDRGPDWLTRPIHLLGHRLRRNSRGKSRRNISEHYDLGNDFFERFLDPTLTYSAGIFERPEGTMEEASQAKYERICRKLSLRPTEYFRRQCHLGASFLPAHEAVDRHRIGVDKLLWGSDYPHLEGTWPNTMDALRATFGDMPEDETRRILGTNALGVYGFDADKLEAVAAKIGPRLGDVRRA